MVGSTMRARNVLAGVGLAALVAGFGATREVAAVDTDVQQGGATGVDTPTPAAADPVAQKALDETPIPEDASPLSGLDGAATALSAKDYGRALKLLDELQEPQSGSDRWFLVGALQGRALRLSGRPADAVETLEPRWSHRRLGRHFPRDVLGLELARARMAWANSGELDVKAADAQRTKAVSDLGKVRRLSPLRNEAEIRVEQARALWQMQGTSRRGRISSAKKAIRTLNKILSDYPYHPLIGQMWLERARALVRAEREGEAARELRKIAIARAGEPEAEDAFADLEALAAEHRGIKAQPFSKREDLDRAQKARGLRRVELSRELLDRIIDDPDTPKILREQAILSRSYTAYTQRDYARCADDLGPIYEETKNVNIRDRLIRCSERAARYEEAVDLWLEGTKTRRRGMKAHAIWEAMEMAIRGGLYERAEELLEAYEKLSKGHHSTRRWLRAWLPYRLGRFEDAIDGFKGVERHRSDRIRAKYFRGKLLLKHGGDERKAEGEKLLRQVVKADPLDYYGLIARQRLREAGSKAPPLPELEPMADEARPPPRAQTQATLDELDEAFGNAWPPIRRARQLYAAGYLEAARREVRVAVEAYTSRGKRSSWPRSEAVIQGLGWRSTWKFPRTAPTRAGRKMLRDRAASDRLRVGLRMVARGVEEPHAYVSLTDYSEYPWKSRWHPRAYRASLEREARLRKIDPIHLWSLMFTESRFRRHVVSPVGARGALQIMPWTARQLAERLDELEDGRFNDDLLFDIDVNAHLATYYISELLTKFHGQPAFAYASYNGGPYNVARWLKAKAKGPTPLELDVFIEEIPFRETYRYTRRVLEVSAAYALLYGDDLPRWSNEVDPEFEDNIDF